MKKVLVWIVAVIIFLFLGIVVVKSISGEEFEKGESLLEVNPFALENIQEQKTDPVAVIKRLERDREQCIATVELLMRLSMKNILSEEAFVVNFLITMNRLSEIESILEMYRQDYPKLVKPRVPMVWV